MSEKINLMHLVASMDPDFAHDSLLQKKNVDPNVLRDEFYKSITSAKDMYTFEVIKNDPAHCSGEYNFMLNGKLYTEDIPYDSPEYFDSGVTKMVAKCCLDSKGSINGVYCVLAVNYEPSNGKFTSVLVNIGESFHCGSGERGDFYWSFGEEENVDFDHLYSNYPIILKEFIDDGSVGVGAIINHIKNN
jgi:hypothetical protein